MQDDAIIPFRPPAPEPELLERYLAGECSDGEVARVRAWAGTSPTGMSYVDELREAYRDIGTGPVDVQGIRRTLLQKLGLSVGAHTALQHQYLSTRQTQGPRIRAKETSQIKRSIQSPLPLWRRSLFTGIAATIGALGLVTIAIIGLHSGGRSHASTPVVRAYSTAQGQRATITLASGARAVLGPATTLVVTTDAADRNITVQVTGQALFTVTHNNLTPFVVRAGNAVTRILGTTFMVRRYSSDVATLVAVSEGRVSLQSLDGSTAGTPIVLVGHSRAVVNDSGQVNVTPNIAVEDYTAWTTGRLVFRQTPVRDIVVELSRAYGADIRLADTTLAKRALTWTVPVSEKSLTGTLENLVTLLDAHVERSGTVITIAPGRAKLRGRIDSKSLYISESQYGR